MKAWYVIHFTQAQCFQSLNPGQKFLTVREESSFSDHRTRRI